MSITRFTKETGKRKSEIHDYVDDERIIRVLFKNNIYFLREIQKESIRKGLFFNKSFLVVAPSGSGKTLIGELCIVNNILKKYGKSVYLVPFKALASEKYSYFKSNYEKYGIKTELSIGDVDVDDKELRKADVIVTTYEKMDSILRNFKEKDWIGSITTIIIDEIHTIAEKKRGPRLESLIVRLNEFLNLPQIIALSATVANAKFFGEWLSTLGQKFILIKSDDRPVPLKYSITLSQNKDSAIKRYVKQILEKNGQVIVFLNRRKGAQKQALLLGNYVKKLLNPQEISNCKNLSKHFERIKGGITELKKCAKNGTIFHHAGLLPKERYLVEEYFNRRVLKVICCTTTLSAGVNTPARLVIVKDFKKYETSGDNVSDFSKMHEAFGRAFTFFEPFSANQIFQMLGRAGRPGMDNVGHGIILVGNYEEKSWVEKQYFKRDVDTKKLLPVYNQIQSAINSTETLKEQVLLRIYEKENITLEELKSFFEKTFFFFQLKDKKIPIEEFLRIKEMTVKNILKLHSNQKVLKQIANGNLQHKITRIEKDSIEGSVKSDFGLYKVRFHIEKGIGCNCNFENRVGHDFTGQSSFIFVFCEHITSFLIYLLKHPDEKIQTYLSDIVPKSVKDEYIVSYLIEKGLINTKDGKFWCSKFGDLIIRLYLYPSSGVQIREIIERENIMDYQGLINLSFNVLKSEGRIRDQRLYKPLIWWADEEPLQNILDTFKILAGDLFSTKENIVRIITFIGIIAQFLDRDEIATMCETLSIRLTHGIREDLFDLVLRLNGVGRVRARALFKAGYTTASKVLAESPHKLRYKTGLSLAICKSIVNSNNKKKSKANESELAIFKPLVE